MKVEEEYELPIGKKGLERRYEEIMVLLEFRRDFFYGKALVEWVWITENWIILMRHPHDLFRWF
jgi:hypothetical protein